MVAMETGVRAQETGLMPVRARVHLTHALVQKLASDAEVDLLHLKGPAFLPELRPPGRHSSDVDVLVRPSHLARLIGALEAVGWEQRTDFATGSVFAHAANWWHDDWGWVDVHVSWPGVTVDPEQAYDVLAGVAQPHDIAHTSCLVPDRTGQLLVLVLHAARSAGEESADYAWSRADAAQQAEVRALAETLRAEVALAAGLGELERFRDDPTYALWHYVSHGGSRLDEWRARLAAARSVGERARLLTGVFRVNRDHLRMELGRPPTRQDLRRRQLLRIRRAAREVTQRMRRA
jgi:hypothetical protein